MDNITQFENIILIFLSASIVSNVVFSLFLGLCPFIGVSKKKESALGMGIATTFVMFIASQCAYGLNMLLTYCGLEFLILIAFIAVIASAVQLVEMVLKKFLPSIFTSLGVFLPLITTNCAILGVALFQTSRNYTYFESIAFSLGSGAGFILAMMLMSGIREKIELNNIASIAKGTGIAMIIAGILSMAFMGFQGIGG